MVLPWWSKLKTQRPDCHSRCKLFSFMRLLAEDGQSGSTGTWELQLNMYRDTNGVSQLRRHDSHGPWIVSRKNIPTDTSNTLPPWCDLYRSQIMWHFVATTRTVCLTRSGLVSFHLSVNRFHQSNNINRCPKLYILKLRFTHISSILRE